MIRRRQATARSCAVPSDAVPSDAASPQVEADAVAPHAEAVSVRIASASALLLVVPLTASFLVLLALASCAGGLPDPSREERPRSIVVESYPAEPSTLPLPPRGTTSALVDATVEPAHLTVTSWGTPGCMPYPVTVAWADEVSVQVSTASDTDHGCSTEYLAVSQVVVLPTEHPAQDVRAVLVDGKSVTFGFRR